MSQLVLSDTETHRVAPLILIWDWLAGNLGPLLSSLVLGALLAAAIWPSILAPYDPTAVDMVNVLSAPSSRHFLGTDENGRDVLSRIIYGAQSSLKLGFGAVVIALFGGAIIGITAALSNKLVDTILMRIVDVGLAFPELLLALVVITFVGPGSDSALVAIGIATIPNYSRLIRSQALSVRRASYVEAAHALGLSYSQVLFRHILPNAARPVLILAAIGVGTATLAGASLSFIGLGVSPPTPEWGSMLATARNFLRQAWWLGFFPGIAIILLVVSTSVLGRHLQRRAEGR